MYDTTLTRQSLPNKRYLYLLGVAVSVFSSNNGFIIENIIRTDSSYSWYDLIDKESGRLKDTIKNTISANAGNDILTKFSELVEMRNRIIHGFRITSPDNKQILATKERITNKQFHITEGYLIDFIKKNDELSSLLLGYRGF